MSQKLVTFWTAPFCFDLVLRNDENTCTMRLLDKLIYFGKHCLVTCKRICSGIVISPYLRIVMFDPCIKAFIV